MSCLANPPASGAAQLSPDELSTSALLDILRVHAGRKLVFHYDGHDVRPSYHVTEVKSGAFHALDCGANPESWSETFIQLWDIVEETRGHMPVGKFLAIMRKVSHSVPLDLASKLTFEVSDGVRPMQLYRADAMTVDGDIVRVSLSARPSSCKPRDRWLEEQDAAQSPPAAVCCGTGKSRAV